MEVLIPSLRDDSLAPAGRHVLSAQVQYAPYAVKGGWDAHRAAFLDNALASLEQYAPGYSRVHGGQRAADPRRP